MSNLNSVGACRSGFSLLLSSRLYKTFVRPIFEYGLAITILRKKDYTEIERIQDKCLRMIVGGHATSSTAVLKHICNLPSMQFCSDILISNFCICAQSLLSGCLLSLLHLHHPQSSSLPALSKNSLFVSIPITLNFHSNTKLKRFFETFHQFKFDQMRLTNTKVLLQACHLLWWLKLKKFLRGRIEDLRLGMKIRENLCRFCLLRKIWYQSLVSPNEVLTSKKDLHILKCYYIRRLACIRIKKLSAMYPSTNNKRGEQIQMAMGANSVSNGCKFNFYGSQSDVNGV
ncbi:hypothetical protein PHYBLDRAFT_171272 [Phycomyces blakesleeanus NRRL 1555(-)]|uniref:Uncharacterized protein n=1 Tax=Phycomyces blakesleeanus (strain ATCC 8743b / DSM 1359 / FGSC 10004 / NBRC 33097 / NRRL 1555) TaxID=763407 RepID=A0A162TRN5_PHYB8|nr:hypothetical protein PHYBLDRAFT_171272 [Phycomyces blakesleeanus NRRL 1555(-)]OAD70522.1 hypothetical protein PHYBLDRAFT_171272 [Phycomyces blakesleeanus NRRL 1555(-)]|eukprot:XP_018288562.1 hypothetical protein PHYBLDRAFT_171272 [Phycomyces blakesleeanus NRRL 1555(-)]